jgi:hypothetical protein
MPKAPFQVAIVFAPGRLISAGVTRGDVDQGLAFLLKLQPNVQRFIQSTRTRPLESPGPRHRRGGDRGIAMDHLMASRSVPEALEPEPPAERMRKT